jgi:hypothetical protein
MPLYSDKSSESNNEVDTISEGIAKLNLSIAEI